jgi:hypothetical protein
MAYNRCQEVSKLSILVTPPKNQYARTALEGPGASYLCWSWMTRIQKRADTLVVKWTTSLFTSSGVEPVMSSQSACKEYVSALVDWMDFVCTI